jgi:uncharacterized protein (DUF2237 family)
MENPVPDRLPALMLNGAVPLEVRITDCVAGVLTSTLPKPMLEPLTERVLTPAFSWRDAVRVTLPAVAVMVAVCVVVTAEAVAVKAAVVDPLDTVTDAGTVTALLLLVRFTVRPPLVAAEVRVAVQASVAAPVRVPLAHEMALSAGGAWPVPLRLTVAVPPEVALLVMVSVPVTAPAVVGSKVTTSVAV